RRRRCSDGSSALTFPANVLLFSFVEVLPVHKTDSVLVVGSVAFDDLEMPSGSFKDVLGGAATYSSIAISLLARARLVGVVGTDFAEEHLTMLKERGIDTAGVERVAGKTFRWAGRYASDL